MLWQVGPLTISRRPYNIEEWRRGVTGAWARKPMLGHRPDAEFTGEGPEEIVLRGTLHPFNRNAFGGLSSLALAQNLARTGSPVFVTRGDGTVYGWYAIEAVEELHGMLGPHTAGIGQVIGHELNIIPIGPPGMDTATEALSQIISLFA